MKLLDAVNEVLTSLGERPVTSTTVPNPTLSVVIPEINAQRTDVLVRGLWFNRFKIMLPLELGTSYVKQPIDALEVVPLNTAAMWRDGMLFNVQTSSFVWDRPQEAHVTYDIPFESLPEVVAKLVTYKAAVSAYSKDIGAESVLSLWMRRVSELEALVEREHLRSKHYSTSRSAAAQRMYNAMRG